MTDGQSRTDAALVPTGRELKSHACIRSLDRRGVRTILASDEESIPQFSSRHWDERVALSAPPTDVPGYRDALLEHAARPDVRTILPVREADAYVLSKYRDAFAEHVSLVVPELETLRGCHDRLRLARLAEEAGVPTARTRLLGNVESWDHPVVVKSRYNLLTGDAVADLPDGRAEEVKDVRFLDRGETPDVPSIYEAMAHEPIVQAYVPRAAKQLYCGLWDRGEPVATYQHREIRGSSWVGGGGVYRVSDHSAAVERVAHDLLEHLEWHGLACIEYIQDAETGEWKFLEINPRLWQSLPAAVQAGAEFPHYYWQCALGATDGIDPGYETGVGCHLLYGEVGHLLSILRDESALAERPSVAATAWDIAKTCVTHPRFDYLHLDDPGLFVGALRSLLRASGDGRQFHSGA